MNSWIIVSKGGIWRSLLVLRRVDRTGRLKVTGCRLRRVAVPFPARQNKELHLININESVSDGTCEMFMKSCHEFGY
jgi:hypothetical protein